MLPSANRLKKKKDFERVFKGGKSLKSPFLVLKVVDNKSKENKFGFIVSQKVSKKAVVRNKVRRRLGAIIRKLDVKKGNNFVFIALLGLDKKDFTTTKNIVEDLLKKTGNFK